LLILFFRSNRKIWGYKRWMACD